MIVTNDNHYDLYEDSFISKLKASNSSKVITSYLAAINELLAEGNLNEVGLERLKQLRYLVS